jgi:predicted ATPase
MRSGGQSAGSAFIRRIRVEAGAETDAYPFTLPVVQHLIRSGGVDLTPGVTFLIGENGSGKSTLIEAIAGAAGFNPEGGSRNFRFATRSSESSLGQHLVLTRSVAKPQGNFFLRAESFYNVATEIERLNNGRPVGGLLDSYGGVSLHQRSHGQSFLDLTTHRFGPNGLYLLDEPEAALSVRGCLALLTRMADLTAAGSQFLVATHSPVLLALPGAAILEIAEDGSIARTEYDDALPVRLTRDFMAAPGRFLRYLLEEGDDGVG